MYARFENNTIIPFTAAAVSYSGRIYLSPSEELLKKVGVYPVVNKEEDGKDALIDGVIYHYLGAPSLEDVKTAKIAEINEYDTSASVNSFIFNDNAMWFDKATRVGLMNSTNILKSSGQESCPLWGYNQYYTIPCDTLIEMLSALEIYALECYNVTQKHIQAVEAMQSIEEVKAFEVNKDYPTMLTFNF